MTEASWGAGTFLAGLPAHATDRLGTAGVGLTCDAHQVLIRQGDAGDDVLLLLAGWVKVGAISGTGAGIILGIRGPGDLIGELSVVDRGPRSATVRTLETVAVRRIPSAEFLDVVSTVPELNLALVRLLARRLRESDFSRLRYVSTDSFAGLVRFLLDFADRYGRPGPDGTVLIARGLTQDELAEAAAMSREMFQRGMRALRERNLMTAMQHEEIAADPFLQTWADNPQRFRLIPTCSFEDGETREGILSALRGATPEAGAAKARRLLAEQLARTLYDDVGRAAQLIPLLYPIDVGKTWHKLKTAPAAKLKPVRDLIVGELATSLMRANAPDNERLETPRLALRVAEELQAEAHERAVRREELTRELERVISERDRHEVLRRDATAAAAAARAERTALAAAKDDLVARPIGFVRPAAPDVKNGAAVRKDLADLRRRLNRLGAVGSSGSVLPWAIAGLCALGDVCLLALLLAG